MSGVARRVPSALLRYLPSAAAGQASHKVHCKYTYEEIHSLPMPADPLAAAEECLGAEAMIRSSFPPDVRKTVLEETARMIKGQRADLAELIALETGKTRAEAAVEVDRCFSVMDASASCVLDGGRGSISGGGSDARSRGFDLMTRRYPSGPVLMVTPFNFPLNLAAHKVGPAVAAGCPFVLKPSDLAPLSATVLVGMLQEAGWPIAAGQAVMTDTAGARSLGSSGAFAHVSFTGSPGVGWAIASETGGGGGGLGAKTDHSRWQGFDARGPPRRGRGVTLELGGTAPVIVDETYATTIGLETHGSREAAIAHVAKRIATGAFFQSGQSCVSVQRVIAHESVFDELTEAVIKQARAFTMGMGDPLDASTVMGPLISVASAERVARLVRESVGSQCSAVYHTSDGTEVRATTPADSPAVAGTHGNFFPATVIVNPDADTPVRHEEAFGPVAYLEKYDSGFAKACEMAGDTRYGLQCGVFTGRVDRALNAMDRLHFGGVVVNDIPSTRLDDQPYGGAKESGVGREGVKYAIEAFTEIRAFLINRNEGEKMI